MVVGFWSSVVPEVVGQFGDGKYYSERYKRQKLSEHLEGPIMRWRSRASITTTSSRKLKWRMKYWRFNIQEIVCSSLMMVLAHLDLFLHRHLEQRPRCSTLRKVFIWFPVNMVKNDHFDQKWLSWSKITVLVKITVRVKNYCLVQKSLFESKMNVSVKNNCLGQKWPCRSKMIISAKNNQFSQK